MGEVAVNGRGPVMAGDPIDEVMLNGTVSESKENVEGFINGAVELTDRVKRRAKRPSKFMTKELSRANSDTQVIAPLRALKNSRKSRNGFGRGLPKKGEYCPALVAHVKLCRGGRQEGEGFKCLLVTEGLKDCLL